MIWQPKIGQEAIINYKNKSMPLQGIECVIYGVSKGAGPRNVMVLTTEFAYPHYCQWFIVPKGNLNAIQDGHQHNKSQANPACHRPAQED